MNQVGCGYLGPWWGLITRLQINLNGHLHTWVERLSIVPEFASRLDNNAGCRILRQTLGLGVRVAGLLSGSGDAEPAAGAGAAAAAEGALWRHGDMSTSCSGDTSSSCLSTAAGSCLSTAAGILPSSPSCVPSPPLAAGGTKRCAHGEHAEIMLAKENVSYLAMTTLRENLMV